MVKWIDLTRDEFKEWVEKHGDKAVAIVPLGSIENHGPHLPLGTDSFTAYAFVEEISKREDVIVLPVIECTSDTVQRGFPGCISIRYDVIASYLENIFDEIRRNGIRKIVLLSFHGGNRYMIPVLQRDLLEKGKDYVVFSPSFSMVKIPEELMEYVKYGGHAGVFETSWLWYFYPDKVHPDKFKPGEMNEEVKFISKFAKIDWSIKFPSGVDGDPTKASREIGKKLAEAFLDTINKFLDYVRDFDVNKILRKPE
ncbi:MAG: creatininase family protein [Candidatus Asgardarchaeia archaeon]